MDKRTTRLFFKALYLIMYLLLHYDRKNETQQMLYKSKVERWKEETEKYLQDHSDN